MGNVAHETQLKIALKFVYEQEVQYEIIRW